VERKKTQRVDNVRSSAGERVGAVECRRGPDSSNLTRCFAFCTKLFAENNSLFHVRMELVE
jgi:hypothetical protein